MAEKEFFRRWPLNASTEYIAARKELLEAEMSLRDQIERVAAQRRTLPPGAFMPTYSFDEGPKSLSQEQPITQITLQQLVEEKSLVVYHLMFADDEDEACPSCSMWIDGFNGVADHLDQHVTFVVMAKAPLPKLRSWARVRGWHNIRLLSCSGSTFNLDMNLEHPDWMPSLKQAPGVSVFHKDGDAVRHVYSSPPEFTLREGRALDLLSPVWNVLDIVPEGRGDWNPSNSYVK
jgi:predicted dithiol-disulfide oxidoreductase (DUF899 family)